jgi:hypothetical protein
MAVIRDIKYLNKDFTSLRDNLISYAKTYFPDTYNDFTPSSPGMMFMEMAAYVGDVLSFYLDNQVQETYLQYARQTNNIYDLAYMLGYKPKVTSVASVNIDFYQQIPAITSGSTYIPDYTYALQISPNTVINSTSNSTIKFLLKDKVDFTFSSSLDPTTITVYSTNGPSSSPTYFLLKKTRNVISSTIKSTTVSFTDPIPFNYTDITDTNIVGILDIVDSTGNVWYEVDNLAQDAIFDSIQNTNPNDPNFSGNTDTPNLLRIKQIQNRFATRFLNVTTLRLLFGAGSPTDTTEVITPNPQNVGLGLPFEQDKLTTAYSPTNFIFTNTYGVAPANTTLTIRYLVGGGVESNVQANDLASLNTTNVFFVNPFVTDSNLANQIIATLQVNNSLAATGGSSGDSLDQIRQNSLSNFQSQLRAVTADDYNIRALSLPSQYGSVGKIFTTKEKITDVLPGESLGNVSLYILSLNQDGTLRLASDALKQNIITYLSQFRVLNDSVKVKDAFIINISVEFDIVVLPNYNNDDVLGKCILYLQDYFDINKWQINQPILLKNLFIGLDAVDGVQTVKTINIINQTDPLLGYSEFAYDINSATLNNVIYPSIDPMIFELKYPNVDIKGRVVPL